MILYRLLIVTLALSVASSTSSKTQLKKGTVHINCLLDAMVVKVPVAGVKDVQLSKWSDIVGCGSVRTKDIFTVTLSLSDDLPCGTTKVKNRNTGDVLYYHTVAVTLQSGAEEDVLVKCRQSHTNSTLGKMVKRDVLPPEFVEPDYIEITSEVSGTAPVPILGVGVRQNGALVDGQINVVPGTPLSMEVFLDDESASTYGILVSNMEVTDTNNKKEIIVFNGCSLDSFLFENFLTDEGDYLSAKFRAFKFPESSFVLFRGTVDVCLDKCKGIACSNGQVGFGRRRRAVDGMPSDKNKIFQITMTTIIKFKEMEMKPDPRTILGYGLKNSTKEYKSNLFHGNDRTNYYPPDHIVRRTSVDPTPTINFNIASTIGSLSAVTIICIVAILTKL